MLAQLMPKGGWLDRWKSSPLWVRVVPFVVFLLLTGLQGRLGDTSRYWIYALKTLAGAGMIWAVWSSIPEMRWNWSWEAWVAGVAVFILWIGLDGVVAWMKMAPSFHRLPGQIQPWNPHLQFGSGTALAWLFVGLRLAGATLVVPPLEEVFYRSFVYRFVIQTDFLAVPLSRFHPVAFAISSLLFALEHQEWLAGLLCGMIYQGLVVRRGRLGDAIAAHTITNGLLGLYVVMSGAWYYW
jgi:uncharacterized protein